MPPEQKSNGALVGAVIIVLILVIGGIYLWQKNVKKNAQIQNPPVSSTGASLDTQLNNVDVDSLDKGI